MKHGLIICFMVVLFISLISATPYILFVNPTPNHNYQTTGTSLTINSTITNLSTLDEFIFNWDGTNYSLYDEDLVLMMNFENSSELGENDTIVRDLSKYGNNGTVFNGASLSSGKYGRAYNFSDQRGINISSTSISDLNGFSISFWIKPNQINASQLDCSRYSCCILTNDKKIFCWGDNTHGNLGDNSTTDRAYPVQFVWNDLYDITKISKGSEHTCALLTNGSIICWGLTILLSLEMQIQR